MHRTLAGVVIACGMAAVIAAMVPQVRAQEDPWPVSLANYHDVTEVGLRLQALADYSSHAQLFTIGSSIDYESYGGPHLYPIYAIRISASTDEQVSDDVGKNAILFEAGAHPREWLTTESLLTLAEHLVDNAERLTSGVPGILGYADVWIVPLTTPGGRAIDDTHFGDPRFYSTSPERAGWRGNGDTRGCDHGVNVARNFSAGWTAVPSIDCVDDPEGTAQDPVDGKNNDPTGNYRGFAPFATLEAAALRQFVQNHSISMVVVLHANAQQIWNRWGNADVAGTAIANRAMAAFNGVLIGQELPLARDSVGGGYGQFSAWLTEDSDTAGQPDEATTRRIQTIYVELPIDNYTNRYRYEPRDGSNGFHPSNAQMVRNLRMAVVTMARRLIGDAGSPGCYLAPPWAPQDQNGCPDRDFGLVGAKIATGSRNRGVITTDVAGCLGAQTARGCDGDIVPARDRVPAHVYTVYYRVQNFSTVANNDIVDVRLRLSGVTHGPEGDIASTPVTQRRSHTLATQEADWGWFTADLTAPNTDYTIALDVRPRTGAGVSDGFARNDKKVFRVTTAPQPQIDR
jgi:hypothetical protein